ncbi:acyl-CoA dehydrogenase family protein [Hwanghaeella sp. LZ110]|jgi:acyl-CoA dehydrogenase|uniref:acyl-CoA dehydrogenase family protein n=1 Tax=Hwanghaeella sp. LZ110 TaxID=3402810 RepID=UPI000C3E2A23|nr:acyl-CoA dehydrogenase [Rhodospirillales bacterium]MAX64824.1 acyl-CoA dehydrogenase [Rhodospirillaceae bacterium]MBB59208.1 acyl-CoA dehydrogenase [Rhodospirillaceae bacterium]|tara:strand:+ start:216 stop:1376 length:1161 start_codon:yes stop_codon:yes gene_type:complete
MALDADTFRQITETIDRFVRDRLIPAEAQVDEDNAIPPDIVSEMRDLGLFGLSIPEEYGGLGLTMVEEVELAFRLGRASPAFRSLIGTNNGIGSQGILLDGTEQQKQTWLPRLASGEVIGSFALTEPDSGSDAASISLSADPDGVDFILNGTKRYITNAPIAGLFTVMARTDRTIEGAKGITAFLVEGNTPGLSVGLPDRKMGQRGTKTADVVFQNCRVPASSIIGGIAGRGFSTAMKVLDRGRLHISAVCVGAAERLLDDALSFAMNRRQFNAPISEFQLIQAMLADSRTELYAGKCMVMDAARRRDLGEAVSLEASCCKLYCSEMVGRVADRAVQIHGGAGYMADYPVERFYRDVRLFRLYEGTSQIQQLVIARNMIRQHQGQN